MKGSLGPSYSNNQIENILLKSKAQYSKLNTKEIVEKVSEDLKMGKAIGWMQGRMEFGPRALGEEV